ncbi:hypothetical protein, partial [Flectobacillus roseus]|uniref:hypothetical protein n=1 Tax=Flectobacillus roseus TaxID=502259 RepID=UPI0024B70E61
MKKIYNLVASRLVNLLLCFVCAISSIAQTSTTDLTSHQPTTIPAGAIFEWHTGATSYSPLVSVPTAVVPGIYYGLYNYGSGCYSEAAPIRIITNSCPITTVDLNSAVNTPPSGVSLSFHSALPVGDANAITGTSVTSAGAGTYYVAYKTTVNGINCYSNASPIIVTITLCCPTISNVSGNNVNPSICGSSDGSIKICGLGSNSTGWTINYDNNGVPAAALVNQSADVNGCVTISGLTAGTYTNIKFSHPTNCPSGSNTLSVTLSNPSSPLVPTSALASPSAICSGSSSVLSATCATGTLSWYTDSGLTGTALASATVSPTTTTTYYGACVNGTCKSP